MSLYLSVVDVAFHVRCSDVYKEICFETRQRFGCFHLDPNELNFVDENRQTSPISLIDCFALCQPCWTCEPQLLFSPLWLNVLCFAPFFPPHQWIFCNIMSWLYAGNKEKVFCERLHFLTDRNTKICKPTELFVWDNIGSRQLSPEVVIENTKNILFLQLQRSSDQVRFLQRMLLHFIIVGVNTNWDVLAWIIMSSLKNAALRA